MRGEGDAIPCTTVSSSSTLASQPRWFSPPSSSVSPDRFDFHPRRTVRFSSSKTNLPDWPRSSDRSDFVDDRCVERRTDLAIRPRPAALRSASSMK